MKQTNEPQEVMLDDEIEEEILLEFQEIIPGNLICVGIEDLETGDIIWFFKPFIKWVHDSEGTMYARVEDEHDPFGFRDYRLFDYEARQEEVQSIKDKNVAKVISNLIRDYVTETIAMDRIYNHKEINPVLDEEMFEKLIDNVMEHAKILVD